MSNENNEYAQDEPFEGNIRYVKPKPISTSKFTCYDPKTHVAIQKPVWYTFKEKLPDESTMIYLEDMNGLVIDRYIKILPNDVVYTERGYYFKGANWTYAKSDKHPDGLDLSPLMPSS